MEIKYYKSTIRIREFEKKVIGYLCIYLSHCPATPIITSMEKYSKMRIADSLDSYSLTFLLLCKILAKYVTQSVCLFVYSITQKLPHR